MGHLFLCLNNFFNSTEPATFIERLEPLQLLKTGDVLELKFKVIGTPPVKITWSKDDRQIQESAKHRLSFTHSEAVLLVNNCTVQDSGEYVCEARNEAGTDLCSSIVTVKGLYYVCLFFANSLMS